MDMKNFKFDLQRFADTTIPAELVLKYWAKQAYEAGIHNAYFNRFIGDSANSIVHRKTELAKGPGTSITIPLLMPLKGAGVLGDNILEGNEEALNYLDFNVGLTMVRNAVRLTGRFEEQKTQINMRRDAKNALADWLSMYIDTSIFAVLTGILPTWAGGSSSKFDFPLDPPTDDRILYAGSATSEATITTSDKFTADLIGQAKRLATADEDTAVRPINVDGRSTYVMVIDPYQARDLRDDEKWIEAQKHANVRGEKNPIFSGAMGIYEGVVIHEHIRIPRTETGSGGAKVGHALFLGAQAVTFAEGEVPRWEEKTFDYGNKYGVAIGRMMGLKKAAFKYDGENLTDFGVVNVLTSSADDTVAATAGTSGD